jgi:hypothetical protein
MSETVYEISSDHVAHEVIEGDAILINFTTGRYFSLDGSGGRVWEILAAGPASASTLAESLSAAFAVQSASLRDTLAGFLEELREEGLVAATERAAQPPAPTALEDSGPFDAPILRKYTDLEALLLLDPIHDALPSGWPNTKPEPS